jgi:hypothetical protein
LTGVIDAKVLRAVGGTRTRGRSDASAPGLSSAVSGMYQRIATSITEAQEDEDELFGRRSEWPTTRPTLLARSASRRSTFLGIQSAGTLPKPSLFVTEERSDALSFRAPDRAPGNHQKTPKVREWADSTDPQTGESSLDAFLYLLFPPFAHEPGCG